MNKEFNDVLGQLVDEAKDLFGTLDEVSQNIKNLESALIRSKANMPFYFKIQDSVDGDRTLSWEECPAEKSFRIFHESSNCGKKKFSEVKLLIRVADNKYLIPFMIEFIQYIKDKKREIFFPDEVDCIPY